MPMILPFAFPNARDAGPGRARGPAAAWPANALPLEPVSPLVFPRVDSAGQRAPAEPSSGDRAALEEAVAKSAAEAMAKARTAGFEQGRAEGSAVGRAEAKREIEELRATLRGAIEALARSRDDVLAAAELDLAEIVLTLAGDLAAGAVSAEPARVVELARQGMGLLSESDAISIRAAARPAALLREEQAALVKAVNLSSLRIIEDPSLAPEGCVVESSLGRVDLRVSQRLQAARELLCSARDGS
jgi:flagellar biosynthesis/type III secretory pathway protein FliH